MGLFKKQGKAWNLVKDIGGQSDKCDHWDLTHTLATHGPLNDVNSYPYFSEKGKIFIIHYFSIQLVTQNLGIKVNGYQ